MLVCRFDFLRSLSLFITNQFHRDDGAMWTNSNVFLRFALSSALSCVFISYFILTLMYFIYSLPLYTFTLFFSALTRQKKKHLTSKNAALEIAKCFLENLSQKAG